MRAVVLGADGQPRVLETERPRITAPGQVLMRNSVSTICGSDMHIIAHPPNPPAPSRPGYPGHESVGTVVESSDPGYEPGDAVLAVPTLEHASGFAEFQVLPVQYLIPLGDQAPPPATAVLAQQLGTVIYGMKRFWQGPPGRTAVVLGAGSVGLLFVRLCVLAGFAQVVVSDLHGYRLTAATAMGATHTVLADGDAVVTAVRSITEDGADLVIEAAGTDTTRVQAVDCVALSGRIGMFGLPEGDGPLPVSFDLLFRRKPTIEFCYDAQSEVGHASFREALRAICCGDVDVSHLGPTLWPLEQFTDALDAAAAGREGVVKAGIAF